MWIVSNKSFLSIVENVNDTTEFVVRARIAGDLEAFFGDASVAVIETDDSDYRFRVFVDKELVRLKVNDIINNITYHNFKDSVKEKDRKVWYTRIWSVMYDVQETLYNTREKWWGNYRGKGI